MLQLAIQWLQQQTSDNNHESGYEDTGDEG